MRKGIVGADDSIEACVTPGQPPHVGHEQRGVDAGRGALPPRSLDRAQTDVGAEHAMAQAREADELSPDSARNIGDVGGSSMPAAQQSVQSLRLSPALVGPVGIEGMVIIREAVVELRGRHPLSLGRPQSTRPVSLATDQPEMNAGAGPIRRGGLH